MSTVLRPEFDKLRRIADEIKAVLDELHRELRSRRFGSGTAGARDNTMTRRRKRYLTQMLAAVCDQTNARLLGIESTGSGHQRARLLSRHGAPINLINDAG
jgi:hypothetical protein